MKNMWELKQSVNQDVLDLYIYGDVTDLEIDWVNWCWVESENSAKHFREELSKYPNVTQINVYINSYGGSVFEGTAIYTQLKRHSAYVTVYIDGFACSVASVIAMAGDKVIMPSNTMMMIHNASMCSCGNAKELRKMADDLDAIMKGNRQVYLEKSNGKITEDKLIELLDGETWLTAENCLEYGFADEVSGVDADLTTAKQMLQKVNKSLEQHLSYNKALTALAKESLIEKTDPIIKTIEEPKQLTLAEKLTAMFVKKTEE